MTPSLTAVSQTLDVVDRIALLKQFLNKPLVHSDHGDVVPRAGDRDNHDNEADKKTNRPNYKNNSQDIAINEFEEFNEFGIGLGKHLNLLDLATYQRESRYLFCSRSMGIVRENLTLSYFDLDPQILEINQ